MQAFGITTPPAFVITKPWFNEPFADESWEQLLDLANQHNMPVHAVIQGSEEFKDINKLLGTIEQLDILFGNYDDKIERALRAAKSRELAHQIEKRVGKVFKSTTIQFGVGATGATVTLTYNEEGAHT